VPSSVSYRQSSRVDNEYGNNEYNRNLPPRPSYSKREDITERSSKGTQQSVRSIPPPEQSIPKTRLSINIETLKNLRYFSRVFNINKLLV